MNTYSLYTDGGARGNPGPAGVGGIIKDHNGSTIAKFNDFIGIGTNNIAEYTALINGLKLALNHDIHNLDCFLDSELIVKQLNREYKVKNKNLKILFDKVNNYRTKFNHITFTHVKRNKNAEADALVNQALDSIN